MVLRQQQPARTSRIPTGGTRPTFTSVPLPRFTQTRAAAPQAPTGMGDLLAMLARQRRQQEAQIYSDAAMQQGDIITQALSGQQGIPETDLGEVQPDLLERMGQKISHYFPILQAGTVLPRIFGYDPKETAEGTFLDPVLPEQVKRAEQIAAAEFRKKSGVGIRDMMAMSGQPGALYSGALFPAIARSMASEEAKEMRKELEGKTTDEVIQILEEKEPGSTTGYIELFIPSPFEAVTMGVGKIPRVLRMAAVASRSLPIPKKLDDFAESVIRRFPEKPEVKKVLDETDDIINQGAPELNSIEDNVQGMIAESGALGGVLGPSLRKLENLTIGGRPIGKKILERIDRTKTLGEYIEPAVDLLKDKTRLLRSLDQSHIGHEAALAQGHGFGNLFEVIFRTKWARTGLRINDDATITVRVKADADRVENIGFADFMEESSLYKPVEVEDFSDEFWELRGEAMKHIDDVTEQMRKRGIEINEVTWATGPKTGNKRHHYFPRGPAMREGEELPTFRSKGRGLDTRTSQERQRIWNRQTDGIEDGLTYDDDFGRILGRYTAAAYQHMADKNLSDIYSLYGKKLDDFVDAEILDQITKYQNINRNLFKVKRLTDDIINGKKLPRTRLRKKMNVVEEVKKAGFANKEEAIRVGRMKHKDRTEEMRAAWKKLDDGMKRAIRDDIRRIKKLGATVETDVFVENRTITTLREILDPDDIDALIAAQLMKSKKARRAHLKAVRANVGQRLNKKSAESKHYWELRQKAKTPKERAKKGMKQANLDTNSARQYYFTDDVAEYMNDYLGDSSKHWQNILTKFNNFSRMATLTADNAAPFNQGLYLMATSPEAWTKVMAKTTKAFTDPRYWDETITENADFWRMYIQEGGSFEAAEWFEGLSRGELIDKLRIGDKLSIRKAVDLAAERPQASYNILRDEGRREMFEALRPAWEADGRPIRELVSHVDNMIGISRSFGLGSTQKSMEAMTFLARGYYRAHMAVIGSMMSGGIRGKTASRALGKLLMSQVAIHTYASRVLGQEPNLDPSRGDFLMNNVGGAMIGIPGFQRAIIRLIGDIMRSTAESISPDPYAYPKDADFFANPMFRFLRGRASATVKTVTTLVHQETYMGEQWDNPLELALNLAGDLTVPIIIQDLAIDEPRLPLWAAPFSFLGMNARPESYRQQLNDVRNRYALEEYGQPWTHEKAREMGVKVISREQRNELERIFPEIREVEETFLEDIAERDGKDTWGQMNAWVAQQDELRETYIDKLDDLQTELRNQQEEYQNGTRTLGERMNTKLIRDQIRTISADYGLQSDALKKRLPAVEKFFDITEGKPPLPTTPDIDIAVDDYYRSVIFNPALEENYLFDYDLYEQLEKDFVKRWDALTDNEGEAVYWNTIKEMRLSSKLPQVVKELNEAKIRLKPYWGIGNKIAEDMGALDLWKEQTKKGYLGEEDPIVRQIRSIEREARKQLRRQDRYMDLALFRFYDTETFEHPDNIRDFDTTEGKAEVTGGGFNLAFYDD